MIIIKNAEVVLENESKVTDVAVKDGKIFKIADNIEAGKSDEVRDGSGCYLFPGFIDPHVHMQMTNAITTTADSYESGTKAAIYGGTTTIINFATAYMGMSLRDVLEREKSKADDVSSCHYLFHCEMIDVNENTLAELKELSEEGLRSVKAYLAYTFRIGDRDLYKTIKVCRDAGLLLEAHCENGDMLDAIMDDLRKENKTAMKYKSLAHPEAAEADSIGTMGRIAKLLDAHVHVVHLSSKEGLEELRYQRKNGVNITAETCPQYLYLDKSVYQNEDKLQAAKYVCAPPPRQKEDQDAILEAIVNGEIQTLATDHCAYKLKGQKDQSLDDFRKCPGGLPGVEERAQLFYTKLVASGKISPVEFSKLMSTNSAKLYKLYPQKGVIKEGSDADLVLYNPNKEHTFTNENVHSLAENTVYDGIKVQGVIQDVYLDGVLTLDKGKLVSEKKGRFLGKQAKN